MSVIEDLIHLTQKKVKLSTSAGVPPHKYLHFYIPTNAILNRVPNNIIQATANIPESIYSRRTIARSRDRNVQPAYSVNLTVHLDVNKVFNTLIPCNVPPSRKGRSWESTLRNDDLTILSKTALSFLKENGICNNLICDGEEILIDDGLWICTDSNCYIIVDTKGHLPLAKRNKYPRYGFMYYYLVGDLLTQHEAKKVITTCTKYNYIILPPILILILRYKHKDRVNRKNEIQTIAYEQTLSTDPNIQTTKNESN